MIEPSPPSPDCPHPERWETVDTDTPETEVVDFIVQLAATLKPSLIIETGTYTGNTASLLGTACDDCEVLSCDIEDRRNPEWSYGYHFHSCPSLNLIPLEPVDMLFLDSALEIRAKEVIHFRNFASPRCVIVIHDTGDSHPDLKRDIQALVANGTITGVFLPTPRGLFIGRYA